MSDLTTVKRQYNEAIGALYERDLRLKKIRAIAEPQVKAARERDMKSKSKPNDGIHTICYLTVSESDAAWVQIGDLLGIGVGDE